MLFFLCEKLSVDDNPYSSLCASCVMNEKISRRQGYLHCHHMKKYFIIIIESRNDVVENGSILKEDNGIQKNTYTVEEWSC